MCQQYERVEKYACKCEKREHIPNLCSNPGGKNCVKEKEEIISEPLEVMVDEPCPACQRKSKKGANSGSSTG